MDCADPGVTASFAILLEQVGISPDQVPRAPHMVMITWSVSLPPVM